MRLLKSTVHVNDIMWNFHSSLSSRESDIDSIYTQCGLSELALDDGRVKVVKEKYLPVILRAAGRHDELKKWRMLQADHAKVLNQEFGKKLKAIEKEFIGLSK